MQPFATPADAAVFGRTVTATALTIASARIRRHVGARIEDHPNVASDGFIELVTGIAHRLDSENPSLSEGVVQASSGGDSVTLGWDSFQGVTDLLKAEMAALDKLFPNRRLPGTIVVPA